MLEAKSSIFPQYAKQCDNVSRTIHEILDRDGQARAIDRQIQGFWSESVIGECVVVGRIQTAISAERLSQPTA